MQIFADRIEFCWIHLRGISALENSLWAYDAQGIRIWLNALAIEQKSTEMSEDVKESVTIPLAFYPLCEFLCLDVSRMLKKAFSCVNGQRDHYRSRKRARDEIELAFRDL